MTQKKTPSTAKTSNKQSDQSRRDDVIAQATKFIVDNDTWMLATCGRGQVIRSRPMLNVNKTFNGDLFLFAHRDDRVLKTITDNPKVNIMICEPSDRRYASITGKAQSADNPKKAELLWNSRCTEYFQQNKPGPGIALIKVDVNQVEYWDANQSIMTQLGNLFRMTSTGLAEEDVEHHSVNWSDGNQPVSESLLKHQSSSPSP